LNGSNYRSIALWRNNLLVDVHDFLQFGPGCPTLRAMHVHLVAVEIGVVRFGDWKKGLVSREFFFEERKKTTYQPWTPVKFYNVCYYHPLLAGRKSKAGTEEAGREKN
tara:strand:- start:5446 stop:5769 length:324 start_codon:yes stop_codon:yes gene_type:complete